MNSRPLRLGLLGVTLLLFGSTVLAQIAQDRGWFSVDGGAGRSSGGAFAVTGTIGQPDAGGMLRGGPYTLAGGFWGGGVQAAAPIITGVTPGEGRDSEDVTIVIVGNGFVATPRVLLGETALEGVTVESLGRMRAVVPAGLAPGLYDLSVINPGGLSAVAPGAYRVVAAAPPQPQAVAPTSGLNDRATAIVITGENFASKAEVRLNATPLSQVVFVSATRLEAVVPAGLAPGSYALSVVNPGNRVGTLPNAFSVRFPPPQLGAIVPRQGRNDRATTLVINGVGFRATPQVDLNGRPLLNVRFNDTSQIEATVPARLSEGVYTLRLLNPDGQQASVPNAFTVTALPPLPSHDLAFAEWELTQGIQDFANGVPLVADKPTYVRVYGRNLAGVTANGVTVALEATRGGVPLPGSPLIPLNFARTLAVNQAFDRNVAADSWIFKLPPAWTASGNLTLRATFDPNNRLNDPNRLNNSRTGIFSFTRKAPVCGVFIRVRTHAPLPAFSSQAAQNAVEVARQMLPTADLWTYTQGMVIEEWEPGLLPWDWGDYGPYESDDKEWILIKLQLRDTLSDDPDECDDAGARTHYIGMIHQDSAFAVNGSARRDGDQMLFRLPPDIPASQVDLMTARIATLPHELGHNYGRLHVNCPPGGPANTDNNYPYPSCDIAPNNPASFYGFFALRQLPVTPQGAGDLMSYAHQQSRARWISDYTWRALFGAINNRSGGLAAATEAQLGARAEVANAAAVLVISGVITPTLNQAVLQSGWNLPAAALSPGIATKLQGIAAPAPSGTAGEYHLRLRDAAGQLLDERLVAVLFDEDEPAPPGSVPQQAPGPQRGTFVISVPDPGAAVARIELVRDATVLAAVAPGAGAPVVDLLAPTAGQRVAGRLELVWRAADPDPNDRLRFTLQYSPDDGARWHSLAEDIAADIGTDPFSFAFDNLAGLPGGAQARVRVIATDGYNTTIATSQPFAMTDQAPEPFILTPGAGQRYAAGEQILLRGSAIDTEDGALDAAQLSWQIDGKPLGPGAEQILAGLAPGAHRVSLSASDSTGQVSTAQQSFSVAPLSIPAAGAPSGEQLCGDPAYAGAARVQLTLASGAPPAQAALIRTASDLWVCVDGLPPPGDTADTVAVLLDANHSRDPLAQPDDYRITVDAQGLTTFAAGDGTGGYSPVNGSPLPARVGGDDNAWSAELRIPFAQLPGLSPVLGLGLELYKSDGTPSRAAWPWASEPAQPRSWAMALLGVQPSISGLAPASAPVGSPAATIVVSGTGFLNGSIVRWNGADRPTTFVSESALRAEISAADLAMASHASVTVVNPGLEAAPSAPSVFSVENPTPTLSSASFDLAQRSGTRRTLIVEGSDFAPGATLFYEGVAATTTVVDATTLRAEIDVSGLVIGDSVGLMVYNPSPGGGGSNLFELVVTVKLHGLHLPLVRR